MFQLVCCIAPLHDAAQPLSSALPRDCLWQMYINPDVQCEGLQVIQLRVRWLLRHNMLVRSLIS
jgi:hypothetical protein